VTDEELRDALDGLRAYDEGATDSGIRDEDLRARCKAALREREADPVRWREFAARLVRDLYLTDEAIGHEAGLEDAAGLIRWLDDRMGCTVTGW
jgi:hypothetical protein